MSTLEKIIYDDEKETEFSNKFIVLLKTKIEPVIEYFLYIIGMIVVLFGTFNALFLFFQEKRKGEKDIDEIYANMRIQLSETISLALTFILGAEIVKTFRIPNIYQLIKISLVVLLRQIITYFLDKDVERLKKIYNT